MSNADHKVCLQCKEISDILILNHLQNGTVFIVCPTCFKPPTAFNVSKPTHHLHSCLMKLKDTTRDLTRILNQILHHFHTHTKTTFQSFATHAASSRELSRKCPLTLRRCCSHRLRHPWPPPPCRSYLEQKGKKNSTSAENQNKQERNPGTDLSLTSTVWRGSGHRPDGTGSTAPQPVNEA